MNFSDSVIPVEVIRLIQTLKEHQFEGWIVGGAIRMLILNQSPKDWDIATNARPEQVQKVFTHTIETGIAYGTVTVVLDSMHIQVTTFRKEKEYKNHRKPQGVDYCEKIEDDLSRRDFTMNAIAYDPISRESLDPFDGKSDIEYKTIKAVGEPERRFEEDALRILRALRFQSQLGFFIDPVTMDGMVQQSNLMTKLSWERVQEEFSKWLMGDYFSMTESTVSKIELFQIFDQKPSSELQKHWNLIPIFPSLAFRLCAFFNFYFANVSTTDKIKDTEQFVKQLKYSQSMILKVTQFMDFISAPIDMNETTQRITWTKKALNLGFEDAICLLDWKLQDVEHKPSLLKAKAHLVHLKLQDFERKVKPLAIDGHMVMETLGLSPGAKVKEVLEQAEDFVLEDPDRNRKDILLDFLKQNK